MAKIPPGNFLTPLRGVSLRGQFYTRIINGREYVSRWPRKQPTPSTAKEKDRRALLAKAARFTAYMDSGAQAFAADLAKETKLLPRDFLMLALFNRIGYVVTLDGRKIYAMPAVQDVSALLDALGQTPGDILVRGENWWYSIPQGAENTVLTIGPDGLPAWIALPPSGGTGEPWMAPPPLNPTISGATVGPDTFIGLPIMPANEVALEGVRVSVTAPGAGRALIGGIYQANLNSLSGATLLTQSGIIPAASGVVDLLFSPSVTLTPLQFYWLGIAVVGGSGNLQVMQSDVTRNSYMYFGLGSPSLPSTAPTATAGVGGSQFTWWGY